MKKTLLLMLSSVFLFAAPATFAQLPFEQVEQAIVELEAGLAGEGRREELAANPDELYELINSILLPRFNSEYAAQLVLGRNWRDASESQRTRFIQGFYDSLLRKYADGVFEFQSDRVMLLPFRDDLEKPRVIVKTIVTLEDGDKVTVNYGFANRDDSWKMFDVTIEGISYIRNFRAELDSEIKSSSLDAVIERLEKEAGKAPSE